MDEIKAWYNNKKSQLFLLDKQDHHCSWLLENPEKCDFEKVVGYSVGAYFRHHEESNTVAQEYDPWLIEKFLQNGWVRLGYGNDFFIECDNLSYAASALRKFYSYIAKRIKNITEILIIDIKETYNLLKGNKFHMFMKTGTIPSDFAMENSLAVKIKKLTEDLINERF